MCVTETDLGRKRRCRQTQHLVGIVDDVLADLTIAGRHAVELRIDRLQDGHERKIQHQDEQKR